MTCPEGERAEGPTCLAHGKHGGQQKGALERGFSREVLSRIVGRRNGCDGGK